MRRSLVVLALVAAAAVAVQTGQQVTWAHRDAGVRGTVRVGG